MPIGHALFPTLLGPRWYALSPSVRALHGAEVQVNARGRATVSGDTRRTARWLRVLLGLPAPCEEAAIDIVITRDGSREIWRRRFAGARMDSRLRPSFRHGDAFEERLGVSRLVFALDAADGGLRWVTREVRLLAIPLPLRWFGGVDARCSERDGRYRFDIKIRLPWLGLLVAYAGWLEIVDAP